MREKFLTAYQIFLNITLPIYNHVHFHTDLHHILTYVFMAYLQWERHVYPTSTSKVIYYAFFARSDAGLAKGPKLLT